MPEIEQGMDIEDLVDTEDRDLLEAEAAKRGMTVAELAKQGIQKKLTERTRPNSMAGVLQAFRRKD